MRFSSCRKGWSSDPPPCISFEPHFFMQAYLIELNLINSANHLGITGLMVWGGRISLCSSEYIILQTHTSLLWTSVGQKARVFFPPHTFWRGSVRLRDLAGRQKHLADIKGFSIRKAQIVLFSPEAAAASTETALYTKISQAATWALTHRSTQYGKDDCLLLFLFVYRTKRRRA